MNHVRAAFLCLPALLCADLRAQEPPAPPPAQASALDTLVEVLASVEDPGVQLDLLKGMAEELKSRRGLAAPKGWSDFAARAAKSPNAEVQILAQSLSVAFGDPQALAGMRALLLEATADAASRRRALDALLGAHDRELAPALRKVIADPALCGPALRALAAFEDAETPAAILAAYGSLPAEEKRDAVNTLAARTAFAGPLLDAVAAGRVPAGDLTPAVVRQLNALGNAEIDARVAKVWGVVRKTPEEKEKQIREWRRERLYKFMGRPADLSRGRALFAKTCQACHTLYGVGGKIGPDLTGSNRADLNYLLQNIIDPNALVGKDYLMYVVTTQDERVLSGLLGRQDGASVTIVTQNETVVVPRSEIKEMTASALSLMPEGQLDALADDEANDLISYLRNPTQVPMLATRDNLSAFFNGRDLAGWVGCPDLWKVEKGEIVGKTAAGLKRNEFLKSEMALEDFRLIVEVKLVPNEANSGIQFRTEALPDGEVKGYQADVGAGWWGKLYEENGRALLWKEPGDPHVKPGEWNLYEVLAVGHKIRTAINGRLCVDFDDPPGATRGIVAFQIHAGGPTEVRFKNLKLELNPKFELKTVK